MVKSFSTTGPGRPKTKGEAFDLDGHRCHLNPNLKKAKVSRLKLDASLIMVELDEAFFEGERRQKRLDEAQGRYELAVQRRDEIADDAEDAEQVEAEVHAADRELEEARAACFEATQMAKTALGEIESNLNKQLRVFFTEDTANHIAARINSDDDPFDTDNVAELIEWAQEATAKRPTKP